MDSRLRALARRWRETGVARDEAAWLEARRGAGQVTRSGLELLAHLGSAGAAQVLGTSPGVPGSDPRLWLLGFASRGRHVLQRVALSVARTSAARWLTLGADELTPARALESACCMLEGRADCDPAAIGALRQGLEQAHTRWHRRRGFDGELGSCYVWELAEGLLATCLARNPEAIAAGLAQQVRRCSRDGADALLIEVVEAVQDDLRGWLEREPGPPDASPEARYSTQRRYAVGDVIVHTSFGRGQITRAAQRQVHVRFDDGVTRRLVHAEAAALPV